MKYQIFFVATNFCIISLFSLIGIANGQEQITQQGLQYGLLQQGLALIGIVGAAGAAAFFAWQRERRIPPAAEQEEIFENLVKDWYSRSYLLIFHDIWNEIQESKNDDEAEQLVGYYWEILCHKKFSIDKFPKSTNRLEDPLQKQYLKTRLHLRNEEIDYRIEAIKNNADVEYYDEVRVILPSVIDSAVKSVIGNSTNFDESIYEVIVKDTLKATKRLMIFYRLREDMKVVEILIRAKVYEKIKEMNN